MKKTNRFFQLLPLPYRGRSIEIYWTDIYPATIFTLNLLDIHLHDIVPLPGRLPQVLFLWVPFLIYIAPIWDLKDRAFPKESLETDADEELVKTYRHSLAGRIILLVSITLMLVWIKATGIARF